MVGRQRDEDLTLTLGEASLLIDDRPDMTGRYVPNDISFQQHDGPIADGLVTGICWHGKDFSCQPRNGDSPSADADPRNAADPSCNKGCIAG